MKLKNLALILCLLPVVAYGAERTNSARVGMTRANNSGLRAVTSAQKQDAKKQTSGTIVEQWDASDQEDYEEETFVEEKTESVKVSAPSSASCREAYRACMDDFCLLDETEGSRCACSDNIEKSKELIQEIQKIQSEADDLYTVGVEREKLGAKARLVFGESDAAKKSSRVSGIDFLAWLNADTNDGDLGEDTDIGQNLYSMAAESCEDELKRCGAKASMEEKLYSRLIVSDCKAFQSYLNDQKADANANKKTAEAAVRTARLENLSTTNKYNRGECLLVYRSCIADKGGCGVNFENCLDEGLLARRSNACEDVLDQCMAVRKDVLKDWEEESVSVLKEAARFADRNKRATCLAKIQNCLEEGCSTSTETACLTNVNVAAGICPIITECNEQIPGLQSAINDKLSYLQTKFCENDIDSCLKDRCGSDFTKPECIGKRASEIAELCPQSMFPSCKNAVQYDVIVNSAMLHMDYQMLTGCINQFAEKLTNVCGTDMNCLSMTKILPTVNKWVDLNSTEGKKLLAKAEANATAAVDEFFADFDKDLTLSACQDVYGKSSTKIKNRTGMKDSVNMSARMVAYQSAKNRATRELASVMDEVKVRDETNASRKKCLEEYRKESKPNDSESKNYSYIRSVSYEADLHNCHVCRVQQVCEKGGEKKATSALKAAAGGLSAGASAGTMVSPGWGTAIGGLVGAVGAGALGYASGGEEDFCQELESCEDINIHETL